MHAILAVADYATGFNLRAACICLAGTPDIIPQFAGFPGEAHPVQRYLARNGNKTTFLPVDALVNPVNCKDAMGKGLALQFKHRFPGMSQAYRNACRNQSLRPGRRMIMITPSKKP